MKASAKGGKTAAAVAAVAKGKSRMVEAPAPHGVEGGGNQVPGGATVGGRARGDEKPLSEAMQYCSLHVKEFMSDAQKANSYLKCGKAFMEKQGDYLAAIECFNEGINWNPIVSLYTFRAAAHKSLNMWTEAYFDYSFAIRMEPENGSFFCQRGMCLTKLKRIALAVEDLDQACTFTPTPLHFYSRGTILADSGQNEQAIPDFTHALTFLDLITSDLRLRSTYRRALANFELHHYDECLKDLAVLLQEDPNSVSPRALMGRAYKMLENLKRADEQLSMAITLDPNAAEHYAERGDIRFRTGDKSLVIEGVYDFDKAVRLYEGKIMQLRESLSRPTTRARMVGMLRSVVANAGAEEGDGGAAASGAGADSGDKEAKEEGSAGDKKERGAGSVSGEEEEKGAFHEEVDDEEGSAHIDGEMYDGEGDEEDGDEDAGGGEATPAADDAQVDVDASAPQRTSSAAGKKRAKGGSKYGRPAVDLAHVDEAIKLMADALFRRGQAKLLIASDDVVIQAALEDAQAAVYNVPEDDDYQLLVAVCFIRLQRLDAATKVLQAVLARSPHNEKALYQFAFCQRTRGKQKDAIEGLTKIISYNAFGDAAARAALAVPLERVFETRGTLFHEIQAHTFALADLGRAVAMDPERAGNYYLRGDCHSKLGNYELAVADFLLAEEKGFPDLVSLWSSRGALYRLLGDSANARRDFESALLAIPEDEAHRAMRIRLSSFRALCFIDQGMYSAGHDILEAAVGMVALMEKRVELGLPPFIPEAEAGKGAGGGVDGVDGLDGGVGRAPDPPVTPAKDARINGALLVNIRRLKWTLCYHSALALHMQKKYADAAAVLQECAAVHMRPCAPDDFILGAAYFFLGVQQCQVQSLAAAEDSLKASLASKWGQVDKNRTVIIFALGKLLQQQLRHDAAIESFSQSIAIDANNAHAFFRRAWSYKVSAHDLMRAITNRRQRQISSHSSALALSSLSLPPNTCTCTNTKGDKRLF